MGLQRSPWAGINVHGGARDRLTELRAAVDALPDAARSRLTLENCERAYSVPDLRAVGVPVVFDPHHEVVRGFLTGLWKSNIITLGAQIGERVRGQRVCADFNDPHHEAVRSGCEIDSRLEAHAELAMATWPDPGSALAHLSNGLTGPRDRRHSDLISHVFPSLLRFRWIDVEAKGKELAIRALRAMPGWWR